MSERQEVEDEINALEAEIERLRGELAALRKLHGYAVHDTWEYPPIAQPGFDRAIAQARELLREGEE